MEPLLNSNRGRRIIFRFAICGAILLQLLGGFKLHNFAFPHTPEEIQAIQMYDASPSPATWTAMTNQMRLNALHNMHQAQLQGLMYLISFLIADILAFYFLWNYGVKKSAP